MVYAELTNVKGNVLPFPKLMVSSNGLVVFMVADKSGTVVYRGNSPHRIGFSSGIWAMDEFTDFDGTVSLTNEKEA